MGIPTKPWLGDDVYLATFLLSVEVIIIITNIPRLNV